MILNTSVLICLLWSGYEDIREQKIHVIPVIICIVLGIVIRLFTGKITMPSILYGALPGVLSFICGRTCGACIGEGDSLLILCVGLVNGFWFCISFLGFTFTCVFVFSVVMMSIGKLHRKSQVACVPFMIIGYLGAWLL